MPFPKTAEKGSKRKGGSGILWLLNMKQTFMRRDRKRKPEYKG